MKRLSKLARPDNARPAPKGSGPHGRTCHECRYRVRVHHGNKVHQKCGKVVERWTHGDSMEISCRDAACVEFEVREAEE